MEKKTTVLLMEYDKFFKFSNSTKKKDGGTGLMLIALAIRKKNDINRF